MEDDIVSETSVGVCFEYTDLTEHFGLRNLLLILQDRKIS